MNGPSGKKSSWDGVVEDQAKPTTHGLLNRIYSSDLPHRLKHYYACRQICLRYEAMATSILLYDGATERLVGKGLYLNRAALKSIVKDGERGLDARILRYHRRHMLRFTGFYHYVFYWFISKGIPAQVDDVQALKIFRSFKGKSELSYEFPVRLEVMEEVNGAITDKFLSDLKEEDIIEFVQFCIENSRRNAANEKGMFQQDKFYHRMYKSLVKEDSYGLEKGASSFEAKLFLKYRDTRQLKDNYKILFETAEFPGTEEGTSFITKLEDLGFRFKEKPFYVGMPLIAKGRCIGVMRMVYCVGDQTAQLDNERELVRAERNKLKHLLHVASGADVESYLTRYKVHRSFLYALEILGHFLDQTFPQAFLDRIPRNFESDGRLPEDHARERYSAWCTNVQKAINCRGSILRLKDTATSIPGILGRSESIAPLSAYLSANPRSGFLINGNQFHPELEKIFPDVNVDKFNVKGDDSFKQHIVAVLIDFGTQYRDTKVLRYYYCSDGGEELRVAKSVAEIGEYRFLELDPFGKDPDGLPMVTKAYHDVFTGKAGYEGVMPKHPHYGRYMLVIDIPAPDVAGVVTFSNTANRIFTLSDVRFAYAQAKRMGLGLSLKTRTQVSLATRASLHSMRHVIAAIRQIIDIAVQQQIGEEHIKRFRRDLQRYEAKCNDLEMMLGRADLYKENHSKREWRGYDIVAFLRSMLSESGYLDDAIDKGIWIDLVADPELNGKLFRINKKGLWQSVIGILGNAVKRSYSAEQMSDPSDTAHVPGFEMARPNVPGNIKLEVADSPTDIKIKITNCGEPICEEDALKLGSLFTSLDDQTGEHGLGLYLVKKHLEMIDSQWVTPCATANGSCFSVNIKKI